MLIETVELTLRRGARELLRGFDWTVREGERWAVVGANGVGKSTLLSVLAAGGGHAVSGGHVRRAPGAWVAAVTQAEPPAPADAGGSLRDLARAACGPLLELGAELGRRAAALGAAPGRDELEAFGAWQALFQARGGYDLDARLDAALAQVGLGNAADLSAATASGGERRRARLVGALVSGADVLLLDEPTNHLDLSAREWLADHLGRHPGALVFSSHDRAWIDAVATHVLLLGEGAPRALRGGWRQARRTLDQAQRVDAKTERLRRRRIAELEAMAAELRAHGHRGADVRRRRAERELARLARATEPAPAAPRRPGLALQGGAAGGELARLAHLAHGGRLRDVSLVLRGGDRWAVVGPSGSGKTTLLRLIAGEIEDEDPRARRWWRPGASLWHLDQHRRGIADEVAPRTALAAWVGPRRADGLLAQVRLPPEAWARPAGTLSGGERARAGLALLMAREADVLLLDEPTNDLDLPMIEALEAALAATEAAVVVATHDARLIEALGAEVVTIEDGALVRWRGGIAGWRRGVRRVDVASNAAPDPGAPSGTAEVAEASGAPPEDDRDWDRERLAAEEALADPLRFGERERERWQARRRAAEEALLAAWEQRATPPQPPYRTRERGWRVWAEPAGGDLHVWLDGDEPLAHVTVRVVATSAGRVGHLVAQRADDRCLTRDARHALWRGAARLAVYLRAVDAVQVAGPDAPTGFVPLAPGWWVWRRAALEREERWRRPARTRARGRGR